MCGIPIPVVSRCLWSLLMFKCICQCEGLNSRMPLQRKIVSHSMTHSNQSRKLRVSAIGFISCRRAERMQQLSHESCSTLDLFTLGRSAISYLITSTWGLYTSRRFQARMYERLMQSAWWGTCLFLCHRNLKKTYPDHVLHCNNSAHFLSKISLQNTFH